MTAVIYRVSNTHILKYFKSERGAKTSLTRGKDEKYLGCEVCTLEHFNTRIDYTVTVTNLLSGKPATIRASERGGCCDPSTERYHCM